MFNIIKAIGADNASGPLKEIEIKRRDLLPDDIEIEILYCGICHSDLHQIKNDFGGTHYPVVPGHEIVGIVRKIGTKVTKFKVGEHAAIGCLVDSCGECPACRHDLEQFCKSGATLSFNSPDKYLDGKTYGGFSKTYVCRDKYALKMPEGLELASAAPLLCAGITVYSPLKHWGVGAGKVVGILGIGGLGHVAIKIAKAMGAHVVVFTTSPAKIDDAIRLGANEAILSTDIESVAKFEGKIDFMLDTISAKHDINSYLKLLSIDGSLVLVGLPPELIEVSAFNLIKGRHSFSGSNIGGIAETQEMLDFCAEHSITADIELIAVSKINEAFSRLEKGDVKYRFVVDMKTL